MSDSQAKYPRDLAEMESWVRANALPRQRILEIGCGDGALTDRLVGDFDLVGVDPVAAASPHVRAMRFEDLDEAPFDVLFASVALHHLDDPNVAAAALSRLSRPGAVMLVREFDRVAMDHEPTKRWWFEQLSATQADPSGPQLPPTLEEFLPQWRSTMDHHVMTWAAVLDLLGAAGFETVSEEPAAYLFRWGLGEQARAEEVRLARDGIINLVGRRWVGRQTRNE